MRFLDGKATQDELTRRIAASGVIKLAVAFWGQPAPDTLGLLSANTPPSIVCNLKMGGTNPEAIEYLLNNGVKVTQSDHLHGKVYLFDDAAIVGSSNASANGLSLQGEEIKGWDEANILVTEESVLGSIRQWLENIPKKPITPTDIAKAKEAWSRRRHVGIIDKPPAKTLLIDDLRRSPDTFGGRRIFVCVYSEGLSPAGKKSLSHAKKYALTKHLGAIDGFEWDELPDFADLICFWREKNGRFSHDGLVHMPETPEDITQYGTVFRVCHTIKRVAGYPQSRIGPISAWSLALSSFIQDSKDPTARFMDIGAFAKSYLR